MSYTVGPYGIQYNDRGNNGESHRLRWILYCVIFLVVVSFVWMKCRRSMTDELYSNKGSEFAKLENLQEKQIENKAPLQTQVRTQEIKIKKPQETIKKGEKKPFKANPLEPSQPTVVLQEIKQEIEVKKDPWLAQVGVWVEEADTRSTVDKNLLNRLVAAVKDEKISLEIDSLEKLARRPTLVDLNDAILRRLGELNMRLFKSKEPTPWIRDVVVRRGDSLNRIAREHGTTLAAVRNLNNMQKTDRLTIGDKLRVPEFLNAVLQVHKTLQIADLTLKGKFFKRYEVSTDEKKTKSGPPYPITRENGPRRRFSALGIKMNPEDLAEMDMLLAPGSSLVVTEQ